MVKKFFFAVSYLYFVIDLYVSVPTDFVYIRIVAALCFLLPLPFLLGLLIKENQLLTTWKSVSSSLYSAFLLVFVLNMAVLSVPSIAKSIPPAITNYYQIENLQEVRTQTVEYIADNPFVKFKPNIEARSQGFRGDTTKFRYTWTTDSWGFKNPEGRAGRPCDALFIGNSFTEGMGVGVNQTLPASFERKSGQKVYNLGVQGYAPTQMLGAYNLYSEELKPKTVYMVYYSTIFEREHKFLDLEKAKKEKSFTGGISNISREENKREIKSGSQSRRIFTSVLIAGYNYLMDARKTKDKQENKGLAADLSFDKYPLLEVYKTEIVQGLNGYNNLIKEIENDGIAWKQTKEVVEKVKAQCEQNGQEFALVYIPRRASVYYKVLTNDLKTKFIDDYEIEAFEAFCASQNIAFIDPTNEVIEHVKKYSKGDDITKLPYLEIDRHMSAAGYKTVAQVIIQSDKF